MHKKKSLGQHFLFDDKIASKIVSFADIDSLSSVLEIGPGDGALTKNIIKLNPKRVLLAELDRELVPILKDLFQKAEVLHTDASQINLLKLRSRDDEQFIVLGNLPYNASTKILERLTSMSTCIKKMVLMFQKEVAERIICGPGSKSYGRLSLMAQEFFSVKKLMDLKPGSFNPPPKVHSTVLLFTPRELPLISPKDRGIYQNIVKYLFSNRRKMIRKTLKDLYGGGVVEEALRLSSLDPKLRPEELSIKDYENLADIISGILSKKH